MVKGVDVLVRGGKREETVPYEVLLRKWVTGCGCVVEEGRYEGA